MKTPEELYLVLTGGIRRFFSDAGKTNAVLGISGGLDSAVVSCLAQDALGKEQVCGLLMPGPFSTVHSLNDAMELCMLNGIPNYIIPIDQIYHKFLRELSPVFEHDTHGVMEENLQARIRGVLLMAYANKKDCLLLNTSNKSELAMGFGTLYGDLAGALMVLADVYKTSVYDLAAFLNRDEERIPAHTISKEPSAELYIDQKDTDSLPEYDVLDPILHALIEEGKTEEELLDSGTNPELLAGITHKMRLSGFKALQVPPLLAVTDHPLLPPDKSLRYDL
ncbi:MAG TPA: NAD(+) synthase [Bacteroidales bacterium]|jgi:NAD+ synthase (glutamine-hydrolysing)|nr:NAD(+) synthase [Bacteroidales bacterium]OQC57674.1 MAG: Glutamine-dependent NAD(+) synthetase [Bacteroidetes bacterium ADurb.Bin013]MBV6455343.1 Glutamine-dependent NAD(+) synthetase [Bacteroidales bacterium]MCZ2317181.1 NAD(+) synthase [Bacteroidales bacterium]NLZ08214.1 NAD(+) synthase [Bacteroidales bacterium]